MSDNDKYEFEDTPEIKIDDNKVGSLLKVISAVLIIICIYYFVDFLIKSGNEKQNKPEIESVIEAQPKK